MRSMRVTARSTGVIVGLTIAVLIGTGAMLAIAHSNSAARQQRLVTGSYETLGLDAPGDHRAAGHRDRPARLPAERRGLRSAALRARPPAHRDRAATARGGGHHRSRHDAAGPRIPRRRQREAGPAQRHDHDLSTLRPRCRPGVGAHRSGPRDQRSAPTDRQLLHRGAAAPAGAPAHHASLGAGSVRHRRPAGHDRRVPVPRRRHVHRGSQRQPPGRCAARAGRSVAAVADDAGKPAGPDLRDRRRRQGRRLERAVRPLLGLGSRQAARAHARSAAVGSPAGDARAARTAETRR